MDDELRKAAQDFADSVDGYENDLPLSAIRAKGALRAALTKNANAAPQDQNSVSVPLDFLGAVCGALNRWGKSPKLLEKARNFVQHGMGHHTNAVPQDQAKDAEAEWRDPASYINCGTHNKNAARYRMARFKGTISDEWQESLDHWIALDAALAAMKEQKP